MTKEIQGTDALNIMKVGNILYTTKEDIKGETNRLKIKGNNVYISFYNHGGAWESWNEDGTLSSTYLNSTFYIRESSPIFSVGDIIMATLSNDGDKMVGIVKKVLPADGYCNDFAPQYTISPYTSNNPNLDTYTARESYIERIGHI